ncbi:unnamed protein product [Nyctereutes procyonoides]|uniref:(raccoon dog) hypothetical protein n=1 Tax=Nyctereutes procyonoides TaxID=34880 RepID=A0A811YFN2_NYCPR|nr:unnamed protein product [Nyctereutes procyonoides]
MIDERVYFWTLNSIPLVYFRGIPNVGPGCIHDKMRGPSTTLYFAYVPPSILLALVQVLPVLYFCILGDLKG